MCGILAYKAVISRSISDEKPSYARVMARSDSTSLTLKKKKKNRGWFLFVLFFVLLDSHMLTRLDTVRVYVCSRFTGLSCALPTAIQTHAFRLRGLLRLLATVSLIRMTDSKSVKVTDWLIQG